MDNLVAVYDSEKQFGLIMARGWIINNSNLEVLRQNTVLNVQSHDQIGNM